MKSELFILMHFSITFGKWASNWICAHFREKYHTINIDTVILILVDSFPKTCAEAKSSVSGTSGQER